VLNALNLSVNLSDAALPHLAFADGTIEGVDCRVARVSFTGERSYEINVPADYGESLWRALLDAGKAHGIQPFGVEALMRLRMEKGYLHVGADTDATTYPQDIGYGKVIANKQTDFVGRRSTSRSDTRRADRHQFVGVEPVDASHPIAAGAHIVSGANGGPGQTQGWITSSGFSPTLGRHVALAMVERAASRHGEVVSLFHQGQVMQAKLVAPCAVDPEGKRLNA
jgi:sarcosine oxidase subunit alpha